MNTHPNTTAAGISGAVAILVLFIIDSQGLELEPLVSGAVTTLVIGAVLFVGRGGLRRVLAPFRNRNK